MNAGELLTQVELELLAAEARIENLLDERQALVARVRQLEAMEARARKCHHAGAESMNGRRVAAYILEGL